MFYSSKFIAQNYAAKIFILNFTLNFVCLAACLYQDFTFIFVVSQDKIVKSYKII